MLYPLKMIPEYKSLIWGGEKLKTKYNKPIKSNKTGESWEVSCHKNGYSHVENGEYAGKSLPEVCDILKTGLLGGKYQNMDAGGASARFPLLMKIIDACDDLSIQVHPDDDYALQHEGDLGKTEMWYIVDAERDSKIVMGVKENVTKEEFRNAFKHYKV